MDLLTRDAFREAVLARDRHRCVFCDEPAVDAHHITERRLFPDGGYYLDNGASVCGTHHLLCEQTVIDTETVREACGIRRVILPPHLYTDLCYDKWGNPMLPNGARLKGELFHDASVQKILAAGGVLHTFTHYVKYPRTYHLPWSPGRTKDDRVLENLDAFAGREVVVTVKLDGENTTMYADYIHARSIDSGSHESRNWVKAFHAGLQGDIPPEWRICGENLFAEHSIHYKRLGSYFKGFSVWNDRNMCLSWDETLEWFALLGIQPVPVIYEGVFDEKRIRQLFRPEFEGNGMEGYVVRIRDAFHYRDFRTHAGKYVRADFPDAAKHGFRRQRVVHNEL